MENNVIDNIENGEVIDEEGTVIATVDKKKGFFTKAKNWWSKDENRNKVKGAAVKVGAGFIGGLAVGFKIAKSMNGSTDSGCESIDISEEMMDVISDSDDGINLDDFEI